MHRRRKKNTVGSTFYGTQVCRVPALVEPFCVISRDETEIGQVRSGRARPGTTFSLEMGAGHPSSRCGGHFFSGLAIVCTLIL